MKIIRSFGKKGLATVHIGETEKGQIEFVESVPPPFKQEEKWVLILSSLYGCPIKCQMCDAGGNYMGILNTKEILKQIDYMVGQYYPDRRIPVKKFKIQFARVGEPTFNNNVLKALKELPHRYDAPGLMPSLSTIAPSGRDDFFSNLGDIKKKYYAKNFQLQFSLHTTDEDLRNIIIPTKKWSLENIARYGEYFYEPGGRKITLNFILAESYHINPKKIAEIFSPEFFFIKMTPLNPTFRSVAAGLKCKLNAKSSVEFEEPKVVGELKKFGFDVLVSIGELEENLIGSNCGQYIGTFVKKSQFQRPPENSYNNLNARKIVPPLR